MRITLVLLLILCLLWAWCLPGNEVETVSMYMYNGVKLPALPEFEYEYAYIAENVAIKGWYVLFVSDKAFVYDKLTNTMIRQDGSTVMRCVCTGEAWGEFVAHDADSLLAPIWANYDVLDTNGDVRLYATEPAKMWENARSFLIGLAMAFAGKPLPISQGGKEPVTYLYNGIPLPTFPENHEAMYEKKDEYAAYRMEYPYIAVFYDAVYGEYFLYYFHVPQKYFNMEGITWIGIAYDDTSVVNYHLIYRINVSTKEWEPYHPSDGFCVLNTELVWSNHNILHGDNDSIYFDASDRVAAYSYPPVDRVAQCSYNTVICPELPGQLEWDDEVYPHAYIYDSGFVNGIALYAFSIKPTVGLDADGNPKLLFDEAAKWLQFQLTIDKLQWWATPVVKYWKKSTTGFYGYCFPFWSNFDACDSEGKVYLPASEPVPIYE